MELAPQVISFPKNLEQKRQLSEEIFNVCKKLKTVDKYIIQETFLDFKFSKCVSCLDSTSICIKTPATKMKNTYVNKHDILSVTLQGICDSKKSSLMFSLVHLEKFMIPEFI